MNKTNFDIPCVCSFVGNRKSGKTYLMNQLLSAEYCNKFNYIVILNPSISLQNDWDWLTENYNGVYCFEKNFVSVVNEITESLKTIIKLCGKKECPQVLLILDDCIDTEVMRFKGVVDTIATKGRHYNLSCWLSSQRLSGVPRSTRLNSDYVILFSCWNFSEIERYTSEYIPKKYQNKFRDKILEYYKKPYTFLLLDNLDRIDRRVKKEFSGDCFFDEL
jgi:GTPase SAR1 family protein